MVTRFEMSGVSIKMIGEASIIEEFGERMRILFLHITFERLTIKEVGPPPKMLMIDDSLEEDLKTTEGS